MLIMTVHRTNPTEFCGHRFFLLTSPLMGDPNFQPQFPQQFHTVELFCSILWCALIVEFDVW